MASRTMIDNYIADYGFGIPINQRRGNPLPLDNSEVWTTYEAAQNYATNDPTSYVGQILTVIATGINGETIATTYRIDDEVGTLKPLSTEGDIEMDEITEKDIDDILFSVFGS